MKRIPCTHEFRIYIARLTVLVSFYLFLLFNVMCSWAVGFSFFRFRLLMYRRCVCMAIAVSHCMRLTSVFHILFKHRFFCCCCCRRCLVFLCLSFSFSHTDPSYGILCVHVGISPQIVVGVWAICACIFHEVRETEIQLAATGHRYAIAVVQHSSI